MFRECGECTACCTWLVGNAFGQEFGNGKSCKFLDCNKCGIYNKRPEVCKAYQCAWSQYLLPEEMRPDKCGYLVSVEFDNKNGQYLKVLPINNNKITDNVINWFKTWSEKMNTLVIFLK